jgi:hypothetical protein
MHAAVRPIIDEQVAFYREQGYLLIEGLIPPPVIEDLQRVTLTGKAGSVTLLSYAAVDAWPIEKRVDQDAFNSRILSGAPTLTPRMEALPIRLSSARDPSHDSIYDNQAICMRSRRRL